jgi:hypothetical protein
MALPIHQVNARSNPPASRRKAMTTRARGVSVPLKINRKRAGLTSADDPRLLPPKTSTTPENPVIAMAISAHNDNDSKGSARAAQLAFRLRAFYREGISRRSMVPAGKRLGSTESHLRSWGCPVLCGGGGLASRVRITRLSAPSTCRDPHCRVIRAALRGWPQSGRANRMRVN